MEGKMFFIFLGKRSEFIKGMQRNAFNCCSISGWKKKKEDVIVRSFYCVNC